MRLGVDFQGWLAYIVYMNNDTTYNGWANHATWNVALWIGGDEGLYNFSKDCTCYEVFRDSLREMSGDSAIGHETPDGVSWKDSALNIDELNESCFFPEEE